jgi:hypothetical protein
VAGRERLDTPGGAFDTVRVEVDLALPGRFSTSRALELWFTDDARHVLARLQAEFALGSVVAVLTRYRPGAPPGASVDRPPRPCP